MVTGIFYGDGDEFMRTVWNEIVSIWQAQDLNSSAVTAWSTYLQLHGATSQHLLIPITYEQLLSEAVQMADMSTVHWQSLCALRQVLSHLENFWDCWRLDVRTDFVLLLTYFLLKGKSRVGQRTRLKVCDTACRWKTTWFCQNKW